MQRQIPPLTQNAFIVDDVVAAAGRWSQTLGAGPFFLFEHVDYGGVTYRGQPTQIDASVAIGWWGDVQIELIEQHNDAPSIYRDFKLRGGLGLQHVASYTRAYDADLARLAAIGHVPVQEGGKGIGIRFCYVDAIPGSGWMLELIDETPVMREINERTRDVSKHWDGREPLRRSLP